MKSEFKNVRIPAILQVLMVVFLHFITIYFLKLNTEERDEGIVRQMFLMYSAPIFLTYMSCKMALKTRKLRYNIAWLVISTLPSMRILFYLKEYQGKKFGNPGFIEFDFPQIELSYLFPVSYLGIQLILIILLLVMILSKEKPEVD
ncbi:hypothetical protein ACFWMP_04665 [Paenibacillus sp. NPDC058367]|uniref:hypothetical protein n=1 Tax=Paenibacillus sp. NPDC058367 TaxID=3346460 RepID=UPI0036461F43